MHIVKLLQNTPEWESWRNEPYVIGASEAPAICGVSKHTTPLMLFNQKIHGKKPAISEFIEERGHRFELRGYAMSGLILDRVFDRDVCGEHEEHRYIRASFDGISFEEKRFQEIKYVGAADFARVRAGEMLEHYMPQVVQQAFVCGYRVCDFTVYNDQADTVANKELTINDEQIEKVMRHVFDFRQRLVDLRPPLISDADVLDLNDNDGFQEMFRSLLRAREQNDTKFENSLRQIIGKNLPHTRVECVGVRVTKTRTGSVQFRFPKDDHQLGI
jgi:putative phage-type endonuclease